MDLNDRLEELLDLAEKAKAAYSHNQDTDTLSLAFILADQSKELAHFAVDFIRNVEGSQKADVVDDILRGHSLTLDQLLSDFERSQSETDQLWSEIQELAQDTELSENEINAVLNQGFEPSLYGKIIKELAQTSPPNGSNGGGSGGGDSNPPAEVLSATPSPGSAVGTTQFTSLPALSAGAAKFLIKVQSTSFSPPSMDDVFEGNDYTAGTDISASVGEYIVLAAVDNLNQIKGYYTARLTASMIRSNIAATKIRINSTELVSVNSDGIQGDDSSTESSISGDGQRVVFVSTADNLVPGADRNTYNVYVHNRQTGVTEQVNKIPGAMMPIISDNGRYVAFQSDQSEQVSNDTNGSEDIFVRDLDAGTTVRVSVSTNGTEAKNGFFGPGYPSMSGDGRYVAFSSDDTTLIPGDDIQDIFVRDRNTDNDEIFDEPEGVSTSRVSISTDGQSANEDCYYPVISADGRFVTFESNATNLVSGVTTGGIFIRDLIENKTTYIASGHSPDMSDDGRYIVFYSGNSGLVPGDTNGNSDVFIMDRDSDGNGIFDETGTKVVERITLNASGEQVNDDCYAPKISADGRYVTYLSSATNLIPGVTSGFDQVYLYDKVTQQTKLLSVTGTGWPANDVSLYPSISSNAEHISFNSDATNLISNDTNESDGDIFVVDLDLNSPLDTEPPVFSEGSGLEAEEIGPSWVKLSWREATDNMAVTSYSIYRGTNPEGPFVKVKTFESTILSYWDTDVSPDSDYYYYVLAGDEDGNWSDIPTTALPIQTIPEPVAVPKNFPIAAGKYHSLATTGGALVWAWGDNSDGQLGDGTTEERLSPVPVLGPGGSGYLTDVSAIAAQEYSSMALKEDGTVWTWGSNDIGLLGIGTHDGNPHPTPVQVKGYRGYGYLTGVEAIATSEYHSLALKSDGTVWSWGDNSEGELGDGTDEDRVTPVPVKSPDGSGYLTDIIAIAAGDMHSVALKSDGTVWTWGQNSSGQLGNGATDDWDAHPLPQQVPGLNGVVMIATGQYHTLAVKDDGTLWAWGKNYYGELGNGTDTTQLSPVQVLGENGSGVLNNVISVAGGYYLTLAIRNDQSVWAWGYNDYGQLGRPITSYSYKTPAQSTGLTGITHVAAGEEHSLAIDRDGKIWALGYNRYGQLGIGSFDWNKHPTPVQVSEFSVTEDTTPPSVNFTEPYQDAVAVYANKTVSINFNEAVQPGETFDNILFVDSQGNSIDFDKQVDGMNLSLDPTSPLSYYECYTITIPSGALKDSSGNVLTESYSFSFTTGNQDVEPQPV